MKTKYYMHMHAYKQLCPTIVKHATEQKNITHWKEKRINNKIETGTATATATLQQHQNKIINKMTSWNQHNNL